jgi:hypothetical protein
MSYARLSRITLSRITKSSEEDKIEKRERKKKRKSKDRKTKTTWHESKNTKHKREIFSREMKLKGKEQVKSNSPSNFFTKRKRRKERRIKVRYQIKVRVSATHSTVFTVFIVNSGLSPKPGGWMA